MRMFWCAEESLKTNEVRLEPVKFAIRNGQVIGSSPIVGSNLFHRI